MTPAELIADRDAKQVALDAAEQTVTEYREALERKIDNSYADWEDILSPDDRQKLDDLKHARNVAFLAHHSARQDLKDRVHELRREVEALWFKREDALQTVRYADSRDFEQEIREAFDGVRLLIAAIGYDPARDLVDQA